MYMSKPDSTISEKARKLTEDSTFSTLDTALLQRAADILKTVAHPARLRIIDFLEAGEKSVNEICSQLGAPQPYISQNLNLMKAKGILSSRRNGTQVLYSVANKNVIEVIHCVRKHGENPEGCIVGTEAEPVEEQAVDERGREPVKV